MSPKKLAMKKSSMKHYVLDAESGRLEIKDILEVAPLDRTEEWLLAVLKASTKNIWIKLQAKYRKEYFEFLERLTVLKRFEKASINSSEQLLKLVRNAGKNTVKTQYGTAGWNYKNAAKLLASKTSHSYDDLENILPIGKHQLYQWVKKSGRLNKDKNGRFPNPEILKAVEHSKYDLLRIEYEELISKQKKK